MARGGSGVPGRGLGRFNPLLLQLLFTAPRRLGRDLELAGVVVGEALRRGGLERGELRGLVVEVAGGLGLPREASKLSNDLIRAGLLVGVEPGGGGQGRVVDVVAAYSSPRLTASWHGRRLASSPAPGVVAAGLASNVLVRAFFEELHGYGPVVRVDAGRLGFLAGLAARAVRRIASRASRGVAGALERLASELESGRLAGRLYQGLLRPFEVLAPGTVSVEGGVVTIRPGDVLGLAAPRLDVEALARAYCGVVEDYGYVVEPPRGPPVPLAVIARRLGVPLAELAAAVEEEAKVNREIVYEIAPALGDEELRYTVRLAGGLLARHCRRGGR